MSQSKEIALFFGSFNPIHLGHLILANYFVEYTKIDSILFILSPHNPFKDKDNLLDKDIRFNLLRSAIEHYPKFDVSDIEFHLPQPSYTINTLNALSEQFENHQFKLVMGDDNLAHFHQWKDHHRLLDQCELFVYPRLLNLNKSEIAPEVLEACRFFDAPRIEISSTFIRQSIKEGRNVRPLVPEAVFEHIIKNNLYRA